MKAVKIGDLKNNLSHYLRLVRAGETIRVLHRNEPVAELGPTRPTPADALARLVATGRCRAPASEPAAAWRSLKPLKGLKRMSPQAVKDDLEALDGE